MRLLAWIVTNGDRLRDGRPVPPVGEWTECYDYASLRMLDALRWVPGRWTKRPMLHRVECEEIIDVGQDSLTCQRLRGVASLDATPLLRECAEFIIWLGRRLVWNVSLRAVYLAPTRPEHEGLLDIASRVAAAACDCVEPGQPFARRSKDLAWLRLHEVIEQRALQLMGLPQEGDE